MVPPQVWLARSREWTELAKTLTDPELVRIFSFLAAEAVAAAGTGRVELPAPNETSD